MNEANPYASPAIDEFAERPGDGRVTVPELTGWRFWLTAIWFGGRHLGLYVALLVLAFQTWFAYRDNRWRSWDFWTEFTESLGQALGIAGYSLLMAGFVGSLTCGPFCAILVRKAKRTDRSRAVTKAGVAGFLVGASLPTILFLTLLIDLRTRERLEDTGRLPLLVGYIVFNAVIFGGVVGAGTLRAAQRLFNRRWPKRLVHHSEPKAKVREGSATA